MKAGMLGKNIPNLVVVLDSEKGYEFRVQLEVLIPGNRGRNLAQLIASGSSANVDVAKKIVFENVSKTATPGFRKILREAFAQNRKKLQQREKAASGAAKTAPKRAAKRAPKKAAKKKAGK